MEIEIKNEKKNYIRLEKLKNGQVCLFNGDYYMQTNGSYLVRISDGNLTEIKNCYLDRLVLVVKAKLSIIRKD